MKLGKVIAVVGLIGLGTGGIVAAQGCTATASICTGATCPGFDGGYIPPGSDDSGTNPISDDSGNVVEPDGSTPADPCNTCLYGQCVGAYSNCVANTSCLTIYQCATSVACAADGGNCVQDCFNAGDSTGQTLYLALGDCDQTAECPNAAAPCFSTCNPSAATCTVEDAGTSDDASVVDSGGDAAAGTCSQCQAALCSSQLAACAAGTQCATYNQCVLGCTDQACATACQTANSAGFTAAGALGSCTSSNCAQCN